MLDRNSADAAKTAGPVVVAGAHGQSLLLRVDSVPREGETVLAAGFEEPEDGGKATNQAVAAAKLGAPVRLVTLLGNDERGRRWRRTLERHAIDVRFLLEASGATDVGFVMLPPNRIPASGLARRFGCAVVVTAGPLGCFVEAPGEKGRHCPAPKVQVADTTGAGDAFIGGLAARLRAGDDLPAAAAYAATVASFSVTRYGTMPAYPTVADLAVLSADAGAGKWAHPSSHV
ncbi:MAG TPA: PfkB family carbohydrate kinase [Streptosporangiaceae bacterium]|nr:PfkB family carbohydrate kinase [Streptosporangiaceae bacterium]